MFGTFLLGELGRVLPSPLKCVKESHGWLLPHFIHSNTNVGPDDPDDADDFRDVVFRFFFLVELVVVFRFFGAVVPVPGPVVNPAPVELEVYPRICFLGFPLPCSTQCPALAPTFTDAPAIRSAMVGGRSSVPPVPWVRGEMVRARNCPADRCDSSISKVLPGCSFPSTSNVSGVYPFFRATTHAHLKVNLFILVGFPLSGFRTSETSG